MARTGLYQAFNTGVYHLLCQSFIYISCLLLFFNDSKLDSVPSTIGISDIAHPDAVIISHLLVQIIAFGLTPLIFNE